MKKVLGCLLMFILTACGGNDYTPKPVGYFRIDLPEHKYIEKAPDCPFVFETSALSRLEFYTPIPGQPSCWFDISYPDYKAKIHITYKPVDQNLRLFLEESRNLAYEHQIKASRITQSLVTRSDDKVYGLIFDLGGNVASPVQFYLTDSVQHFVRGSLYFESKPNPDSIAPVLDFVRSDIAHLVSTFEWN
jgi:gliding motility-associated lipoprotein GldD